ncbi:class I SAM-dependent methyltransferase [Actinokineospora sp. NBRC 105648]|uniref:class I SAM-dependent methyltransferase n=1 Tax=Actinokineospora sp. NBRC 105648 TaxID=3032206 RepID=UPI0024A1F295|nr:class I SAM-dependent methyltransferase [Actinokineospora sp. NBRC 105648]GLZ38122.1 methyltransferase [Actinokineospora sp. NBRC 105648]
MSQFDDPGFFGEQWADDYDDICETDPGPAVDFLAELAGAGRVLELASGTGRVTVPLAARGVRVSALEGSAEMVAKMREKPGGRDIPTIVGDMADIALTGPFDVVYLLFNTFFNLTDPARQRRCLRNATRVLAPGGALVLECYVPDPSAYPRGEHVRAIRVLDDRVALEAYRFDLSTQTFVSQKIFIDERGGVRLRAHSERYCWPAELDLMAELEGLRLAARYAGWDRRAFGADSRDHVSVYRKP